MDWIFFFVVIGVGYFLLSNALAAPKETDPIPKDAFDMDQITLMARLSVKDTTGKSLESLGEDEKRNLAKATTDPAILKYLALAQENQRDCFLLAGVAENPNTPLDVLRHLSKDGAGIVTRAVGRHPSLTQETIRLFSKSKDYSLLEGLAQNKNTPIDILIELAKCPRLEVQGWVAANHKTPLSVLRKFERWQTIDWLLATNPNCPTELFLELANSTNEDVQWSLIHNKATPVDCLVKLAGSKNSGIRSAVCKRKDTPLAALFTAYITDDVEALIDARQSELEDFSNNPYCTGVVRKSYEVYLSRVKNRKNCG